MVSQPHGSRSRPYLLFSLSAFGFLAGKEVKAAGVSNLGLRDRKPDFNLNPLTH